MSVPRSVADVIRNHVTLEVEGIDRMYLNVYQPKLQTEKQAACFFRYHRGQPVASSALDNISEREVQLALGLTSADRTTIVVAHRLSTLRDADRIFVFDEGRIVEVGNFDHLVAAGGVFTELFMSAETGSSPHTNPAPAGADAGPADNTGEKQREMLHPNA